MSDYHVRSISEDGRKASIIFHIPIPAENNAAGIPLRTALSEYIKPRNSDGTYGIYQSMMYGINPVELTQIQNGELYEHEERITFPAAAANLEKQTQIDNRFTDLSAVVVNRIRERLKFWGKNRNVV